MGKIPCRRCGSCGLYHHLSVGACQCGADLTRVPRLLVDEQIPPDQCGEIDPSLPVFVQKCSACGAENFTADRSRPVRACYNCHKKRVASVVPVPYEPEPAEEAVPAEDVPGTSPRTVFHPVVLYPEAVDDGDEDGDDADRWQKLLGGVRSASGTSAQAPEESGGGESSVRTAPVVPPPAAGQELTLTAVRYGSLSFTLRAGQAGLPFLLGRSAGYGDFLSQDIRVSNEHCYLAFQNGVWVVIDNHSTNGTAVNGRFLDINGRQALHDGDELMLGHHPDSMAFHVIIR